MEGVDQTRLHFVLDRVTGDLMNDLAEDDVVGARVAEAAPRCEVRRMLYAQGDELRGGVGGAGVEVRSLKVIVESAGVVEQLPHGDLVGVRYRFRQEPRDRLVECELVLRDQLQYHRGHEGLGYGSDPELVVGP
ncbi:hypothetical protein GCM10018966_026020 [Streptomyces yanii]